MTAQAIKKEITNLPRQQQADIARFIFDILVAAEDFELTSELRAEIDESYEAIENGEDEGLPHEDYRSETEHYLTHLRKS